MAGLFSSKAAPPSDADDDYSDDAAPVAEDESEEGGDLAVAGPFESYCETVFSDTSSYEEKCDALREAIMTLLEESGGGGGGPPMPSPALGDLLK